MTWLLWSQSRCHGLEDLVCSHKIYFGVIYSCDARVLWILVLHMYICYRTTQHLTIHTPRRWSQPSLPKLLANPAQFKPGQVLQPKEWAVLCSTDYLTPPASGIQSIWSIQPRLPSQPGLLSQPRLPSQPKEWVIWYNNYFFALASSCSHVLTLPCTLTVAPVLDRTIRMQSGFILPTPEKKARALFPKPMRRRHSRYNV